SGAANGAIPIQPTQPTEEAPKRIFWIIPNYPSHASFPHAKPLTAKEKFRIAARDPHDPANLVLEGPIAAFPPLPNSTGSYGQAAEGYGKYYGATYGDVMSVNAMSTGVSPSLLHQGPRCCRGGTVSGWYRLGYAMGQIFISHGDNGKTEINFSEFCG